ncbi:MAG: hypothetical protein J1G06_03885 [Oscillospiraceae bacterium]|nr:hypothetical protein [Oscillospiraceae bacterium]
MKSLAEMLGAVAAGPDERHMFLMIANARVYVFRDPKGRAAAANYLRVYRGISDISFAEARVSKDVVEDSRKVRDYIKMHWRECITGDPVPVEIRVNAFV